MWLRMSLECRGRSTCQAHDRQDRASRAGLGRGVAPCRCAGRLMAQCRGAAEAEPDLDIGHTARELRLVMEEAVAKWMVADVEVGSFLSGGLDSSIIAAMAQSVRRAQGRGPLKTFSVGHRGHARRGAAKADRAGGAGGPGGRSGALRADPAAAVREPGAHPRPGGDVGQRRSGRGFGLSLWGD